MSIPVGEQRQGYDNSRHPEKWRLKILKAVTETCYGKKFRCRLSVLGLVRGEADPIYTRIDHDRNRGLKHMEVMKRMITVHVRILNAVQNLRNLGSVRHGN